MKFIPVVTVVLWLLIISGYFFVPQIILLPFIKFPIFLLLSIFIPISFWIVQAGKKKLLSLLYILIFIFNVSILVWGTFANISILKAADEQNEERIDPKLAGLLISGESKEIRETTSHIIYEKHGVVLPFKITDDEYGTFEPSLSDEATYDTNLVKNYRNSFAKYNAIYQIGSFVLLIAIHASIFMGLVIYLILFDKDQKNNHLQGDVSIRKKGRRLI